MDAHRHIVALLQVADDRDVRHTVRPDEDLGLRVERECLVLALAEQCAERGVIAAVDLHLRGARARVEELAAELEQAAFAAAKCNDRDSCEGNGREREGEQ